MKHRILLICGVIAPVLFVFMTILGGAMRPGYSHVADTVSELFSPGSPNKRLLDPLHTVYALLMVSFGFGMLQFVRGSGQSTRGGIAGAVLFIAAALASVATATVFPQDAWGSPPTFRGQMHQNVTGVVCLLSMVSMILIGIWFNRTKLLPGFRTYSFVTVGVSLLSAVWFVANQGSPIMGLTERVAILAGFQWTFVLALWMSSR
jgi:hypothetical protein